MRLGSYTVALLCRHVSLASLLASLVLFASVGSIGCGGKHQEAKVAESDPWAGYKGTYAPGAADPTPSADDKPKTATAATAEADTKAAEPKPDAKPGKKPKGKRGKKGAAADTAADAPATASAPAAAPDKPVSADTSSPAALYGEGSGSGTGTATTTSASDDTAAPAPKKPKKKAAKKKKPAAAAQ